MSPQIESKEEVARAEAAERARAERDRYKQERDRAIELQGNAEMRMQEAQMRQIGLREERDALLSACKIWRNATESRLSDDPVEAAQSMLPADRALCEAIDGVGS